MEKLHVRVNPFARPIMMVALAAALGAGLLTSLTAAPADARSSLTFEVGDRAKVIADSLNVRSEPGLDSEVLFVVTEGTLGTVTAELVNADNHGWYKVAFDTGGEGWASGGFLTSADDDGGVAPLPIPNEPPAGDDGDEVDGVNRLPNTGTGAAEGADANRLGGLAPLTVLAALAGGAVYGLSRRARA